MNPNEKNAKNAEKNAKIFNCSICDFICSKKSEWDRHISTPKHKILMNPNEKTPKTPKKNAEQKYEVFNCLKCYFTCSKKSEWIRHNSTHKHKNLTNSNENNCLCDCGKTYRHMSSLCAHKKKCTACTPETIKEETFVTTISQTASPCTNDTRSEISQLTNLVLEVVKSNNELQKQVIELTKNNQMITNNSNNHSNNNTNNTNNINSHNKTFNLQVFLNETCKDAMNMSDFVDSLQIQLSDIENVGRNGFVAGISNIIIKNLKALDINKRPIHCNDQKRETVYIRDNNQWYNDSKGYGLDDEDKNVVLNNDMNEIQEHQKLKRAIKQVAHKNICMIREWKAKYPDCIYAESRKSDLYNKIVYESMDHNQVNSDKIIRKIVKEVIIDKQALSR